MLEVTSKNRLINVISFINIVFKLLFLIKFFSRGQRSNKVDSSQMLKRKSKMADLLKSCTCWVRFKYGPEEVEQLHHSKKIDKMLEKDKQLIRRQVKLLLLGAGESGKSTFLKQMKIIHGLNFEEEKIAEFRMTIYQNIIKGMKVLVDARNKLNIPWEDPANNRYASHVMKYENSVMLDVDLFLEFSFSVQKLWKDKGILCAFDRRREFQFDYIPSNRDILHARKATKGITEFTIPVNGIPFHFVDVGGQRSQRQKWFQCFDSVTSILFLVSSSEFDQVLLEDRCTNRLLESLRIFDTIINNRCFSEVSFILFLNKTDLLKEKIERRSANISEYFPQFRGDPFSIDDVQKFILDLFDDVRRDKKKPLFHHYTTAVDTENIKVVFNAVRDTILQKNITQLMLQ
ncbi:guanine nucleotide-binding protein subunit alpha-13-like isoform X2 [Centruroides sculpturatus]|uniref:guanine nucleotide-binding protein subunit alpha-13-like isoform X1 n=1 Tax=Centruroides sculpturatus TaxID=218467 RepID=UPI000C6DD454|nr:guanine nucleotide-binding protein subunit alpha-13-like isoform X1 [Centruroides sculpturatus]XP_023226872.1 guanine nucleotide-binding protein subunit alpha-13-like isoform X2 [Centruroides sculpturatus]